MTLVKRNLNNTHLNGQALPICLSSTFLTLLVHTLICLCYSISTDNRGCDSMSHDLCHSAHQDQRCKSITTFFHSLVPGDVEGKAKRNIL